MRLLPRTALLTSVRHRSKEFSVVGILGPRQSGKTTLAKQLKPDHFLDFEDGSDRALLANPYQAFESLTGLIAIDEIQLEPDLVQSLRVLVDQRRKRRFLILGSASPHLLKRGSETLAGRVAYLEIGGFSVNEIRDHESEKLWIRGGFPGSFLAQNEKTSLRWREEYIKTFLQRDIPQLGISIPSYTLSRFWSMLAHFHGQLIKYTELAAAFGFSSVTASRYVELLAGTLMVRIVPPWFENIRKRLVKQPKIYFMDSGILHSLLDIQNYAALLRHPKLGFSWEGFVLQQLVYYLGSSPIYFWRTHAGAELDFFFIWKGKRIGLEVKFSDIPQMTPSMRSAMEDLKLNHLYVVYPGRREYKLDKKTSVLGLDAFLLRVFR